MGRRKKPKEPDGPTMAPYRPEEAKFINRWKNVRGRQTPTFWDKLDKDPLYRAMIETRVPEPDEYGKVQWGDDNMSMGNRWGVNKARNFYMKKKD